MSKSQCNLIAHTAAAELKRTLKDIITKNPGDLLPAVYLITNRIAPAHAAVELGIGEGIVKKVQPNMPCARMMTCRRSTQDLP